MKALLLLVAWIVLIVPVNAQGYDDPEKLVVALYDEVTFDPGASPDWALVKTMFLEEAVVVLRYGPDNMTVFDLRGWVDDFVTFIKDDKVDQTGFQEEILGINSYVYGDIASINVFFDSHIPGTDRRSQGVDIFQLIKKDGGWKIVSIVNERPAFGGEIPEIY